MTGPGRGGPGPARAALAACGLAWSAAPWSAAAVLALASLQGLSGPFLAWCTKLLLDGLTGGRDGNSSGVSAAVAGLALGTVVVALQGPLHGYADGVLGRAVRIRVTERLFTRVNALPGLAPFEDPATQDRLRLAQQAGEQSPQEITRSATELLRELLAAAGFVSVLLAVWPPMLALVLLAAVPAVVLQVRLGGRQAELARSLAGNLRRQFFYRTLLTEARAAKEVRLFGIGDFLHGRLTRDARAAAAAENALERRGLLTRAGLEGGAGILQVAGLLVAVQQALAGRLSVGDVAVFVVAVTGMQAAGAGLAVAAGSGYRALLLFGHYQALVAAPDEVREGLPVGPLRHGISVRDVWFRYRPDGPWVLRGVDLELPAGAGVGLVGLNGAGKSTLVKLLCGFYPPQRGTISWDGVELSRLDPVALRERIGAVFQDCMEYDLTAAENVGLGRVSALGDRDGIRRAARQAGVDDVLAALPGGYDTLLSRLFVPDEGAGPAVSLLSGGQWQRVALARAVRRSDQADLMILDEPTAGLDAEAEHAVHRRIAALRAGRTSLLISHRLSALRDADHLVVLDAGRVLEQGSHQRLLADGGAYARLFRLQAEGYASTVGAGPAAARVAPGPPIPSSQQPPAT